MLFNTAAFGVFFVVVFSLWWGLGAGRAIRGSAIQRSARRWLLLISSYYFYACWDARFLALIMLVTLVDYVGARAIERLSSQRAKQWLLAPVIGANLGLLGFWKYSDFLLESLQPLFPYVGIRPMGPLELVLPVGISFFTFQGLSYVVDVYRGDLPAERSLERFAIYIAFFPQLVAGPIVRASDFLPRLDDPEPLTERRFGQATWLILGGLLKKVVLADYLATNLVDRVFDLPNRFGTLEVLAAVYGYALQIYGDFSGYSDIAIGVAWLLGFQLPLNFNRPYRAQSLQDFWRRWHISLSTWLRDYLYISLGGSRAGRWKTYRNLLITMLLGGLWHGNEWKFVVWGGLHGLGLALERFVVRARRRMAKGNAPPDAAPVGVGAAVLALLRGLFWFHYVAALWVFFRADNFDAAMSVFRQFTGWVPGVANLPRAVAVLIAGGLSMQLIPDAWIDRARRQFVAAPALLQAVAIVAVLHVVTHVSASHAAPFIYFQF